LAQQNEKRDSRLVKELKARELTAVIKRAIKGSAEDIERILRISAKPIFFQVLGRISDSSEAEDVAQKIALLVIKHISSLRSPYAFNSWLHQIIVRTCMAHNQETWRRNSHQSEFEPDMPLIDEDIAIMPMEATEANDERTRLYQLIRRLPHVQQEMVVMHYLEGLSYREIARMQKVEMGTVSKTLSNARKSLKRMLQEAEQTGYAEQDKSSVSPASSRVDKAGEKWGAVALGPAIAEALHYQANALVGGAETERFVAFCHDAVQANLAVLGATASTVGATTLVGKISALFATTTSKVAAVAVSACVVTATVGGTVAVNTVSTTTSQEETIIRTTQRYYAPTAQILFDGKGDETEGINPSEVSLVLADGSGRAVDWMLSDQNGAIHASGEGSVIREELFALAPGAYTVEWGVVDESGTRALVHRSFVVETKALAADPVVESEEVADTDGLAAETTDADDTAFAPDEAGPDEAGQDEAGQDGVAQDETAQDGAGQDEAAQGAQDGAPGDEYMQVVP
jgi:RNA polymerase sigma-70 factor (ECF subfamily)